MQSTSLEAREKIKMTLGSKQAILLKALELCTSPRTNSELSRILGWTINRVTPRTNELMQKGIVKEAYKRACGITGRTAIAWRIKRPDEMKERQMEMFI